MKLDAKTILEVVEEVMQKLGISSKQDEPVVVQPIERRFGPAVKRTTTPPNPHSDPPHHDDPTPCLYAAPPFFR